MNRIVFAIFGALWLSGSLLLGEEYQTFSDIFGNKFEARIVKVERGQVYLEDRKGTKSSISVSELPEVEQKAVKAWVKGGEGLPDRSMVKPEGTKGQAPPLSANSRLVSDRSPEESALLDRF